MKKSQPIPQPAPDKEKFTTTSAKGRRAIARMFHDLRKLKRIWRVRP